MGRVTKVSKVGPARMCVDWQGRIYYDFTERQDPFTVYVGWTNMFDGRTGRTCGMAVRIRLTDSDYAGVFAILQATCMSGIEDWRVRSPATSVPGDSPLAGPAV